MEVGLQLDYNLINEAAGIGIEGVDYAAGTYGYRKIPFTNNGINNTACGGGIYDDSGNPV